MEKDKEKSLAVFETFKIRRHYDEDKEIWYFSVIDIVAALTDQRDFQVARKYWNKLSERLKVEGSEVVTNCHQLKMIAQDGKMRNTDVADVETILRLVQSVPSKKAEPIKLWLAKVGYERMEEMNNPEKALNRSREYWQKQGRSEKWIQQRMMGQETRNKLTDYWNNHGVKKEDDFAILTSIIHKEWSDLTVKEHKTLKGLKTQNLRDHMNEAELIFTALAELSTRQIAEIENTEGFEKNKIPAKKGGKIAKDARRALEQKTGKSIITGENFLPPMKTQEKINKK
ncbi:MAG: BRO family protein [Ignavibacteriales bacterium]|nr:BRO family protein [Ignavibacteriales bacterium]